MLYKTSRAENILCLNYVKAVYKEVHLVKQMDNSELIMLQVPTDIYQTAKYLKDISQIMLNKKMLLNYATEKCNFIAIQRARMQTFRMYKKPSHRAVRVVAVINVALSPYVLGYVAFSSYMC